MNATKEQEMTALAKIQTIIENLGDNSYLGTAFDGAFNLAKQNIEDDAAYSSQYYIDQYIALTEEIKYKNAQAMALAELKIKQEKDVKQREDCLDEALKENQLMLQRIEKQNNIILELKDHSKSDHEIEKKDGIIVNLKAKLYDLLDQMPKEA